MLRVCRYLSIVGLSMFMIAICPQPGQSADKVTVYITKTGKCYHQDGCRSLLSSKIPIQLEDAAARYTPCRVCKPPVLATDNNTTVRPSQAGQSVQSARQKPTSETGRCQAITKAGTQCKRKAKQGSAYCWQHSK